MTIINNRQKIATEVPSQKYKDNWDAIFGKKKDVKEIGSTDQESKGTDQEIQKDS